MEGEAITKTEDRLLLDESGDPQSPNKNPRGLGPAGLFRFLHTSQTTLRRVLQASRVPEMKLSNTKVRIGRHRGDEGASGGAGSPRPRAFKPVFLLLTVVGFLVPTLITLNLKHAGEDGIKAQDQLQTAMTELRIQDGIEWRLISGVITWQAAQKELEEGRERAAGHLKTAASLGLPAGVEDGITAATRRYNQTVDREVQLIASGDKEEAAEWDEAQVDPAFDVISELLETQTAELNKEAETAQKYGDIGVVLTVLVSLLLVTLVQSNRRRAEVLGQARRQSDARYRALIDQSSDLVAVVSRSGHATYHSPSVDRLLAPTGQAPDEGQEATEMSPRDFVAAVEPMDQARFAAALQAAAPGRMSTGEFRLRSEAGVCVFDMTMQDLSADPSVAGVVLTGHDVTERLALQREMEHRALHDALTGLPNRALLADRFEQALLGAKREGISAGLLLLDLDRFKEVNDTFGHHYGDELLRQIGPRLTSALRGVDTIARLGGDEFAVLLPEVRDAAAAAHVGTNLLEALGQPFQVEGVEMQVEASIGVVLSGQHGDDAITLMQRADIAMYVAKTQHLGVFIYDPDVDSNTTGKLALVWDLRRALDGGELVMHYQPQVNVINGDLVGAEALVRWQHPEHGLILPDAFIPLAERTGLISKLTHYVIDAALAQARVWLDAGRPLPIAVNLSARNLHEEHFSEQVAELLARHGVPPHLLELEVTESAIIIDPDRAQVMLHKLSALGMRISLDDFGAGYTSLSQLTSMPISEIKIDRSFVMKMAEDPNSALIVNSVVELGHNLGMTLVAEGVEDEDALGALAGLGCDVAQGYHLSRPVSAADFDAWSAGRHIQPLRPAEVRGRVSGQRPG